MEKNEGTPADTATTSSTMHSQTLHQQSIRVPRIIPEERDLGDVAKAWMPREHHQNHSVPASTTTHGVLSTSDPDTLLGTHSALPFDMDVPVAYSIPSSDAALRLSETTGPGATTSGDESTADPTTQPAHRVTVDTRRIPCPRLCGASFGPDGGLAVFGNGEVQRMWRWYSSSLSSSSSMRPDSDFTGRRAMAPGEKRGLRTMQDLQSMMKAAKDAQWGEHHSEADASSVTSQQLGFGFFEDGDSEESSVADEESVDDLAETMIEADDKTKGLYETYYGDFRRPLTRSSSTDSRLVRPTSSSDGGDSMGGPSSDMLAPVVKVTSAFAKSAMHRQSRKLAAEWQLGDFLSDGMPGGVGADLDSSVRENRPHGVQTTLSPPRFCKYLVGSRRLRFQLFSYFFNLQCCPATAFNNRPAAKWQA